MSLRAVRMGGIEEAVDRLWSLFLRRLKKEVVEEWYVARMEGGVAVFEARVLVGGLLGRMDGGAVVWAPLFGDMGYRYWDLFD